MMITIIPNLVQESKNGSNIRVEFIALPSQIIFSWFEEMANLYLQETLQDTDKKEFVALSYHRKICHIQIKG